MSLEPGTLDLDVRSRSQPATPRLCDNGHGRLFSDSLQKTQPMRNGRDDGDDGYPNEVPKGKILRSGIRPGHVRPAEYALEEGVPALMEAGSKHLDPRLLFGVIAVGTALLSFVLGWLLAGSVAPVRELAAANAGQVGPPSLLGWARRTAHGPLEVLLRHQGPFLAVVDLEVEKPEAKALWFGVERLVRAASLEEKDRQTEMIRRILRALERHEPPEHLTSSITSLRAMLRDAPR